MNEYKKALFKDGDFELEVTISPEEKTIWMTKEEMGLLFNRDRSAISRHINCIYKNVEKNKEESTNANYAQVADTSVHFLHTTQIIGSSQAHRPAEYFNLEIVLLVAQRVKSNRGLLLQQFLDNYLKENEPIFELNDNNIIIYNNGDINLSVNVSPEEETVWLTVNQISILFGTTSENVYIHISNIISDGELDNSVTKDYLVTQKEFLYTAPDGKQYITKLYNLDMILAVGYRVKSKRAIEFRRWASKVLRQYLIKGHVVNENRVIVSNDNYQDLIDKLSLIDKKIVNVDNRLFEYDEEISLINKEIKDIKSEFIKPINSRIFYSGSFYNSYEFLRSLLLKANKEIILIDPYFYSIGFKYLSLAKKGINYKICLSHKGKIKKNDLNEFEREYGQVEIIIKDDIHDRFLILDRTLCYALGTSLNFLSNKAFAIIDITNQILIDDVLKLIE